MLRLGYRVARDLEDQWELMRPGKNRYENWTEEQLQERFGNIEDKMEAMSLETVVHNFQERVERENQVNTNFKVSEDEVNSLKSEIEKEKKLEEKESDVNPEEEWEEKEYYMTKEDFERMKNPDGTITINGERLVIENIDDVDESEVIDKEVPFLEIDKKKTKQRNRSQQIRKNNKKHKRLVVCWRRCIMNTIQGKKNRPPGGSNPRPPG